MTSKISFNLLPLKAKYLEEQNEILRPRLHDTGMKLCRLKIITFSTIHTVPVELYLLQLFFISLLKFAR